MIRSEELLQQGPCAAHAAATGYNEFPLLRDKRQEVAAVGWVSSFLYFSKEIKTGTLYL